MTAADLYDPPDINIAHREWKANCGPCALAALLGVPVTAVRPYFPAFPEKPWCNPTGMKSALELAGVQHGRPEYPEEFPRCGLAFLQLEGPWEAPGVPVTVAYRHTHWVAVRDRWVYDVNAGEWQIDAAWDEDTMSAVVAHTKRATGWRVRTGLEVMLSEAG